MKLFKIHWSGGQEVLAMGNVIQEAVKTVRYSGGPLLTIDCYEEVEDLPFVEQRIKLNGNVVYNTDVATEIKNALSVFPNRVNVGKEFAVSIYNTIWNFRIEDISGGFISLKRAGKEL